MSEKKKDAVQDMFDAIGSGKGGIFTMTILHDEDCKFPSGGPCTCNPDDDVEVIVKEHNLED